MAEQAIQQLRRQLEQQQAIAEQERAKAKQAEAKAEQAEARAEQEQARAEQERARAEQFQNQLRKTTFEKYLCDNHSFVFKALQLASKDLSSLGRTRVVGKRYPMWLRPWTDFAVYQRENFEMIQQVLGDRQLFSTSNVTRGNAEIASCKPAAIEKDIDRFENVAVEIPTREILKKFFEVEPLMGHEFNAVGIQFTNNSRELKRPDVADAGVKERRRQQSRPSKRVVSESMVQQQTYPDGLGFRRLPEGGAEKLVFVFDYKAAHKFSAEALKPALVKEKLFMEVIQRVNGNKTKTDALLKKRDDAELEITMALTQVFDYMIQRGVAYGYVAGGKTLVLLYSKLDDTRTLYYHLCIPDEDAEVTADDAVDDTADDKRVEISKTAVAQLASFCLLALKSEILQGPVLKDLCSSTELKRWPNPYDEAETHVETEDKDTSSSSDPPPSQETAKYKGKTAKKPAAARKYNLRSQRTCKDHETVPSRNNEDDEDDDDDPSRAPAEEPGAMGSNKGATGSNKGATGSSKGTTSSNKRKGGSSGSSSDDCGQKTSSSKSDCPPTRPYCTQACLLGLKRGSGLDDKCPNVSSHRIVEGGSYHAIGASEFTDLVNEQLRQNPFWNCIAVDPFGQAGKIGIIGALFKLELAPYGYTFVGKGTQSAHLSCLQHESIVYAWLEKLQGDVVPVYLGIVNLPIPGDYVLPGEAHVEHMMLMSWGGDMVTDVVVPDLAMEKDRSSREVWYAGVSHGDERGPNMLWNEERGRVMLIDFDQATFLPTVKPKQLSRLLGKKRKRRDVLGLLYKKAHPRVC